MTHDGLPLPRDVAHRLSEAKALVLSRAGLEGAYTSHLSCVDEQTMHALNRRVRGVDRPTDVLSFPSVEWRKKPATAARLLRERDPETGEIPLGDLMICLPIAERQAKAYGHSIAREITFLTVHGLLHCLGYDHETEGERARMRAEEDAIMAQMGLSDQGLIEAAWQASEHAYAPYSKYRVGAALRDQAGRIFTGVNVENASYGLTICAERNAVAHAVSEGMLRVTAIAIVANGSMPYPCGACRQVLREFALDCPIYVANDTETCTTTLAALLPDSFGPESLV